MSDMVAGKQVSAFAQVSSKLTGGGENGLGLFGFSVALSADGNTALVGAPADTIASGNGNGVGAAWVFTRSGGVWKQQGPKLTGGGESGHGDFGASVALSGDGTTALIGGDFDDNQVGAAWVFTRSGGVWKQQGPKLTGADESSQGNFGFSVALSGDGNTALIGGPAIASASGVGVGAAWVFTRLGGQWKQQGPQLAGAGASGESNFGYGVALSGDGNTALVGGPADKLDSATGLGVGAAWAFVRSGGVWNQQGSKLTASGESGNGAFGQSVALSADGNTALVGGPSDNRLRGGAWFFARAGGVWRQQGQKLTGSGEHGTGYFGYAVALSGDGGVALIGGPDDARAVGEAWAFTHANGVWRPHGSSPLTGSGETGAGYFGDSVALSAEGTTGLIGGSDDKPNLLQGGGVGAAWVTSPP